MKKYIYFSTITYIYKWWYWTIEYLHNNKIKYKSDYKILKDYISIDINFNASDIIITNIITFLNK